MRSCFFVFLPKGSSVAIFFAFTVNASACFSFAFILYFLRLVFVALIILLSMSMPIGCNFSNPASINMPPVPQKGSVMVFAG